MNGQFHDSDDRFTAQEVCWYSVDRRLGRPKSQFGLFGEKALTPNGNHTLNPTHGLVTARLTLFWLQIAIQ